MMLYQIWSLGDSIGMDVNTRIYITALSIHLLFLNEVHGNKHYF